ncbi:bifunctional tRNA (5-methylaminomethyl-2-thiouridine)(34)-methyltransferase MnmD/FAD-dependent 5-carboxymethylaminomethyl-2-thiouridine(34) oxidoreductase MnmC [Endozoicomonas sp. G2_1]|uniref:bifunctional tRNA (5-methylaminomethyl-2-thiouridine)(34)-methyltransferase MnmD/FAD-dependent 5-carboxymethylaminomethyl-2-thiouridine(34) oxidoreductase MnmC n=1 Tax=Endozoicomonas sp. G2_1 TaxID=2821091 RepID=UPI001ADBAE85|nr:bifunctional tRNA (5-methylaminomethyl-2-thiouridine)(34)-methyltransferase MnmD/FAD-dependent 5-carboxymethylaminomethyl-2-thiouridine(34) oxidoreductase MnmC [Endozoicomonas sp. G2_1]
MKKPSITKQAKSRHQHQNNDDSTTAKIAHQHVSFQKNGAPYSDTFDDIYFDTESGCQQSQTVFIDGNNLSKRFQQLTGQFTIAETGFGTGLNFLLTLACYQQALNDKLNKDCKTPSQLHFISTEKYPLTRAELTKSLALLPELRQLSQQLIEQYPDQQTLEKLQKSLTADNIQQKAQQKVPQINASFFDSQVTLTVLLGDASEVLSELAPKVHARAPQQKIVDAWFLDGFSPAKNPEMWSDALFGQIGRLTKPQGTISTFTVAGFVRRGLQDVGFRLAKQPSQGKKKEILTGVFQQDPDNGKSYQLRPIINKPQHVSIIGGGIASACAAYQLTKAGVKVTLYCSGDEIAQSASSNKIGALYPLLHQQQDEISLFYQQAFEHAREFYDHLLSQGAQFGHSWCGLLEVSHKEALVTRQQIFEREQPWPQNLIHSVNAEQASEQAGIALSQGGLYMPRAGWISPPELVTAVIESAKASGRLKVKTKHQINHIEQLENGSWQLHSNKGQHQASVVVICAGSSSQALAPVNQLPLTNVRGQVTNMSANNELSELKTVLCHKGYLTPSYQGVQCIGATFDKNNQSTVSDDKSDQYNLDMLERCMPDLALWQKSDIDSSKARLRSMTPDHWPIVGPMPDVAAHKEIYHHLSKDKNWQYQQPAPVINNLYVMAGLGARGLCTAPLLAEILAADLTASPYPVDAERLFNLAPNRFVIRDIIKRK